MGIEPLAVNVSDLKITRPNRRLGPGGDPVGTDTVIGEDLAACFTEENRLFRRSDGREVVVLGQFFFDPILDNRGQIVPVLVGDLATYTDHQGVAHADEEIVRVRGNTDCTSRLDIVEASIGQVAPGGAS